MGMSASQARLLTLTARLSDLELSAQRISNSKLRLASETEKIATDYTKALNEESIKLLTGCNSSGASTYADLTYENLTGVNSPLTSQYGLSDGNGKLLVTQAIAASYKSANGDLTSFLTSNGCKATVISPATPATYSKNGTAITEAEYTAASTAVTTASDDVTKAGTALNTFASTYGVKGYDSTNPGTWSYTTPEVSTFTTNYSDQTIWNYLASSKNIDSVNVGGSTSTNTYSNDKDNANVIRFYSDGGTSPRATREDALSATITDVIGDVTKALSNSLTLDTDDTEGYNAAISSATTQTKSFYAENLKNKANYKYERHGDAIPHAEGTTKITESTHGTNTCFLDVNQLIKTFLNYFDSACSTAVSSTDDDKTTEAAYTARNGGTSTRTTTGGTGSKNAITGIKDTTKSSANGDEIQFRNLNGQDGVNDTLTSAQAKEKYTKLQTAYKAKVDAYNTAKTTFDASYLKVDGTAEVSKYTGNDVTHYTNLFNRMADGYVTMKDEDSTINSKEWVQKQLQNGGLILEKVVDSKWKQTSLTSDTNFEETTDDTDTAKAEAEYTAETSKIESKDKIFDMQLTQINTEHTAAQTEVDSVKKVIDKNVERSFKIFDA